MHVQPHAAGRHLENCMISVRTMHHRHVHIGLNTVTVLSALTVPRQAAVQKAVRHFEPVAVPQVCFRPHKLRLWSTWLVLVSATQSECV